MAVTLPDTVAEWPAFKLYAAANFITPLVELPMFSVTRNGYELISYSRKVLPDIGRMVFRLRFGVIDGRNYKTVDTDGNAVDGAPSLLGREILLTTSDGAVVWWGEVVAEEERAWPGSSVPAGEKHYHCADGLYRLTRWTLDRHLWYVGDAGNTATESRGNPGYNVSSSDPWTVDQVLGNREPTNATQDSRGYYAHTYPASGAATWTDVQAMRHAMQSATQPLRGDGTNLTQFLDFDGATSLFAGVNPWRVDDGETAFSLLTRIMDRRRSQGLARLTFASAKSGEALADFLNPRITIYAQNLSDITYTEPNSGNAVTIDGATTNGTTTTVDLIGDQRLVDGTFQVAAEVATEYTGVETVGARIEMVCTLGTTASGPGFTKSYTDDEATDYDTAVADGLAERGQTTRFAAVYRGLRIDRAWTLDARDAVSGDSAVTQYTSSSVDVCMNADTGVLTKDLDSEANSLVILELMDTLPLAAGWDYTVNPAVPYTGSETAPPGTVPVQVFAADVIDNADHRNDTWTDAYAADFMSISRGGVDGNELYFDSSSGRYWELNDPDDYLFTVSLRLSNRLRYFTGTTEGAVRRVKLENHKLILAHNGAVVALADDGSPLYPLSKPIAIGGSTFHRIRDDRDGLLRLHKLAVEWYTTRRRTATWQLRCHGVGQWFDADGVAYDFPTLGQLVTTMTYNGRTETLNTPVTTIEYDHISGTTTWITSWSDLDWSRTI